MQTLLLLDAGQGVRATARALGAYPREVSRVDGRRYLSRGLEAALSEDPRPPPERLLDSGQEAAIVAMVCGPPPQGPPPQGRARWTIRLPAEHVVQRGIAETVGRETIWVVLAKMESSPSGQSTRWERRLAIKLTHYPPPGRLDIPSTMLLRCIAPMISAARRSSKSDAVRNGPVTAEAVSLTPAALRVLWTLYQLEQHGERWVHVVEIARVVHLPVESVHRLMTQIRPRKNLRRNTEHPRQWAISESGRSVCRTVESIARELGALVPMLEEGRTHVRSRSAR